MSTTTEAKRVVFCAKAGARMNDEQAARYGEELQGLHDGGTPLEPPRVVAQATSAESPLHDWFDWDDTLAAQRWRLRQAGQMLHSIVIRVEGETEEAEPQEVRYFINVRPEADEDAEEAPRRYVPITVIPQQPALQQQVLVVALRDLKAFRDRYRQLTDLDNIVDWAALDQALERLS